MLIAVYGKGGSGKSTVARYLTHRFTDAGAAVHGFDADASNGTLHRFYGSITTRIHTDDATEMMQWFEETVWPAAADANVIVDLGSGAERIFVDWAADAGLVDVAAEAKVPLLFVGVADPSKDALSPLLAAVGTLPAARHAVIRNHGRTKPGETFAVVEEHPAWKKLASATVVDMPMLTVSMPALDRLNASFADALSGCVRDGAAQIGPFDRQRVKKWIEAVDVAFAPVFASAKAE